MGRMIVGNYEFSSSQDAKLAQKEQSAILKIQSSLDVSDTESVFNTYNKLVSKNYFSTPVGISFLCEMREYLTQYYGEEQLKYVVVPKRKAHNEQNSMLELNYKQMEKLKDENAKLKKAKQSLVIAFVAAVIVIIGMVFLVVTNENLGYFNAEEKVLNKYAAWQERLEKWEEELMLREEELMK